MLRGLVHVLAWSCATGAAVTLSWWGVHTVMTGTAYDPPRALPVTVAVAPATSSPEPDSASPSVSSPSPSSASPSPRPSADRSASASPAPSRSASTSPSASATPTTSGQVRSYDTDGGRVVFDLAAASATLVSATPDSGWSMQVWKTDTWIRVEFTAGESKVSVICTWHDGPPHVDIGNY